MNDKITTIIENLKQLTLLEVTRLIKEIENTFGVDTSIAVPTILGNILPVTTQNSEIIEEKTSFDVILTDVPQEKKIAILKVIRNITGLGLKESKDIVDNVPKIIKEGVTKEESENIKKEIETAGGKVSIK